jgi:hypothetical protein
LFNSDLLKEWQLAYRANPKREAAGTASKDFKEDNKRRAVDHGDGVPIKPEDYWPATNDEDDDDDFEAINPNSEKENQVPKKEKETPKKESDTSKKTTSIDDSDSETEDEEEEIIILSEKSKGSATKASAAKKDTSSSPSNTDKGKPSPQPTADKRTSSSPPMKHTTLPITALKTKKRDRFGRSDF